MKEILQIIREGNDFVVAGHVGPDGDSIGSCFALALALHKMEKNVQVLLEPYARKFEIIPGKQFLFSGEKDDLQPQIFVALDCADPTRLGEPNKAIFDRAKTTICIDHHDTNPGFADYNYIEPTASSASEMVFKVIEQLTTPTSEISAAIYAGIVSDTGGFRYNATAKSTMETSARLMEQISFTDIYNELMHMHRFSAGKALGIALANSGRTQDKKVVYAHITKEMLKEAKANNADLDGIVEYLMGTRDAKAAVFVYEKSGEEMVKISMRSQGPNVGAVAKALGGGGHILAAGATVNGTIPEITKRVVKMIKREIKIYEKQQQ
ncbi:MAG: bifunctional oligoribonuclease/PAP phosphatase NrnA [Defluviitaleaceae bacterium]|nr:bifunctional oligoribonuclease/PAP phosphatase NrnA [Defluviitaleaceae bacterium]